MTERSYDILSNWVYMILQYTYFIDSALQIFQKESHPSAYKGGSGAKEGLSLFGKFIINISKAWFLFICKYRE